MDAQGRHEKADEEPLAHRRGGLHSQDVPQFHRPAFLHRQGHRAGGHAPDVDHEAVRRQAAFGPRRCPLQAGALAVVDLIAVRQLHQLFRVARLLVEGSDERIDQNVVDEVDPHGPREAEVAHLHRGRPAGHDPGPRALRPSRQVDRDVNPEVGEPLRRLGVARGAHIDEVLERLPEPLPHRTVVGPSPRDGVDLEPLPIVPLEQLGHQIRQGVLAEVRREVGDAQAFVVDERLPPGRLGTGIGQDPGGPLRAP